MGWRFQLATPNSVGPLTLQSIAHADLSLDFDILLLSGDVADR